jgi:hypothetical protein
VAALAYSEDECHWLFGTSGKMRSMSTPKTQYAYELLSLMISTYFDSSKHANLDDVGNADAVPMLATAGMRLLSQEANNKVWSQICGKSHQGLTLAPAGEDCGTIAGTTEAYYEYLANAAHGKGNRELTGTFTVGGASAQIAIPLKTQQDVSAFMELQNTIGAAIDCKSLQLEDGSPAPFFKQNSRDPHSACLDDYITFRSKSDIRASTAVLQDNVRVDEIEGLGLVSFLGLKGRGSFVAGGLNEIGNWAKEHNCNTQQTSFADCSAKLQAELRKDVMWKHVSEYFRKHNLNIRSFSYNTYAANPTAAGLLKDEHKEGGEGQAAWKLQEELDAVCSEDNGAKFGYKGKNGCMQALYTSLYITSFFAEPGAGNSQVHTADEIHSDPNRDWSEGKLQSMSLLGKVGASALLHVPLERHTADYMAGAQLHLASVRNFAARNRKSRRKVRAAVVK